jgi:hypothetical protein
MSYSDRDPVPVSSQKLHGPSFGFGTLGLVAVFALSAGMILGGIIVPLLRSEPPDQSQLEKAEAAQSTSRALLFSMYPQTIYASLVEGGETVSTGMSVEQYLTEIEVRSSQAGLIATKMVERKGDEVEVSYAFSENESVGGRTFPRSKAHVDHPKSLVLIFSSGPLPATIALQKSRVDGRVRGAGATFVDLVDLGAAPPPLAEGQFLTPRGMFEIKLFNGGVGAFLDNNLVYPIAPVRAGPNLVLPGTTPKPNIPAEDMPRRLALQSYQPALSVLKDRLIIVASDTATQSCGAKAIILDARRGSVVELPEPLLTPAVGVSNAKDALILEGFCVAPPQAETSDINGRSAPVPQGQVKLSARYDLKTGAVTWQRETVAVPTTPTDALPSAAQTGVSTPWRDVEGKRLASPIVAGGGLVSVACRPGGGVTIALSGLPAPADGTATGVRFANQGGSALAQMRWRASAGGYELDGAGRPNEARAIVERLRVGGMMTVSAAGGSKAIPAPGRAQIDRLLGVCGAPTVAPTPVPNANSTALSKPKPTPPKPTTSKPVAKAGSPQAAKAPPPKPPTKAAPSPERKAPSEAPSRPAPGPAPKPKANPEAVPPRETKSGPEN